MHCTWSQEKQQFAHVPFKYNRQNFICCWCCCLFSVIFHTNICFVLFLIFVLLVSSFSFFRHCLENALYLTFHIVFVTHRCWAEESPSQQARIAFVSLIRSDVLKNCFDKKCISCPVSPLSSTNILVERLSSEESLILSYCVSEQLSWKASAHFSAQGSL